MLQRKTEENTPLILRDQALVPKDTRGWPDILHHMLSEESVLASVNEILPEKALLH